MPEVCSILFFAVSSLLQNIMGNYCGKIPIVVDYDHIRGNDMLPAAALMDNNIRLELSGGQWLREEASQDGQYGFWAGGQNVFI